MVEGTARGTPWVVTIVMRSALLNEPRFPVEPFIVAEAGDDRQARKRSRSKPRIDVEAGARHESSESSVSSEASIRRVRSWRFRASVVEVR
jgi:hypothetical protein